MNAIVISLIALLFLVFFVLYFIYGIGPDGHLRSLSMVVCQNKPIGTFALSLFNIFLFLCLYPEYEPYAWLQWILGQIVVSYNTDEHEAIHTFFFWVLSAIDILVIVNLSINHSMWYFALPLFFVILVFACFIVFNVLAYGVFTYHEKTTDNPLMHTIQSVLEISFLFSIFFFLLCYYYMHLLPFTPLCKIPELKN